MEYSLQKTVINKAEVNFYLDWVPSKKKKITVQSQAFFTQKLFLL